MTTKAFSPLQHTPQPKSLLAGMASHQHPEQSDGGGNDDEDGGGNDDEDGGGNDGDGQVAKGKDLSPSG